MTYRKALDKMDRILEQNLLYDFYGELLTEHQQRVYEDAVYNDMSLSEIAGEQGLRAPCLYCRPAALGFPCSLFVKNLPRRCYIYSFYPLYTDF